MKQHGSPTHTHDHQPFWTWLIPAKRCRGPTSFSCTTTRHGRGFQIHIWPDTVRDACKCFNPACMDINQLWKDQAMKDQELVTQSKTCQCSPWERTPKVQRNCIVFSKTYLWQILSWKGATKKRLFGWVAVCSVFKSSYFLLQNNTHL